MLQTECTKLLLAPLAIWKPYAIMPTNRFAFEIFLRMQRKCKERPIVLLALPLAYQDGIDEYHGCVRYLQEFGCDWKLIIERCDFDVRDFRRLLSDGVDAVLATNVIREDALAEIAKTNLPTVCIGSENGPLAKRTKNVAFVDLDSKRIGKMAADYLFGLGGYADFGCVGENDDYAWSACRAKSFEKELLCRGVRCKTVSVKARRHCGHLSRLASWLRALVKPAALFVTRDRLAAEVLDLCEHEGIRVPQDLAVLGVDNEFILCEHTYPPLSSIRPDFESQGYEATKAIDAMLKGLPFKRLTVCSTKGVEARQSTEASSPAGRLVSRARELMRLGYTDRKFDVALLAKRLKVSRRLLDLRYRQIVGRTVLEDLRSLRIEHARRLLGTTSLTLVEIARRSGFASDSYLSRSFLAAYGKSPREARRVG